MGSDSDLDLSPNHRRSRTRTVSGCSITTNSCDENDDPGEQRVEDVTIKFFYQPRTITLLLFLLSLLFYFAFVRDTDRSTDDNAWHGFLGMAGVFLLISLLICPNGPFVRPHPAIWRLVHGITIIYCLMLVFAVFQSYKSIRDILIYFDPKLKFAEPDLEVYAEDCSLGEIWKRIDIFVVAHFFGWAFKAIMLRHAGLSWLLSVMWEFTEIAFSHLLQNFKECWWDSIFLDVLLCNGLGIHFGLYLCKKLEMRTYHWESIKDIHGPARKLRRVVLQFTPVSWTEVRWMDPKSGKMRYLALCCLCICWQICELNTFFLKHIFVIPTSHWINVSRVGLLFLVVSPTLRQWYHYVTDTRSKRVGTQCWLFVFMTFLEAFLCIRHAKELFSQTDMFSIAAWLLFQLIVCFVLLYIVVVYSNRKIKKMDERYTKKREYEHVVSRYVSSDSRSSHMDVRFEDSDEYEADDDDATQELRRRPLRKRDVSK